MGSEMCIRDRFGTMGLESGVIKHQNPWREPRMANRSEVGKRSRSKGKRGELSLVHALNPGRSPYPDGWKHQATGELISASTGRQHHGGPESPDIRHNIKGVHIEVTHREDIAEDNAVLRSKLDQSITDAPFGSLPIVIWKKNREKWRVSFYGGLTHWVPEHGDTTTCKPAIGSVRRQAIHSEEILQMSLPGFLRVLGYESVPDDGLDTIPIDDELPDQEEHGSSDV